VSFRNLLEGWVPAETQPHLHNPVHPLVGGDMLPSSSPNDPSSTSTTATSTAPGPPGSRMRRDPLPPGPVRSRRPLPPPHRRSHVLDLHERRRRPLDSAPDARCNRHLHIRQPHPHLTARRRSAKGAASRMTARSRAARCARFGARLGRTSLLRTLPAQDGPRTYPTGNASVRHLANIRTVVRRLAKEAALRDPESFTRSWHILMKGSIVSAAEGDAEAAQRARSMAAFLIQQKR
jgi:hypothetical protein